MTYELDEVVDMLRMFHAVESEAKIFLLIVSFPMKKKDQRVKSAQKTLKAIEDYKKLPGEVRRELETDKNNHVSKIVEIERLCHEAIR